MALGMQPPIHIHGANNGILGTVLLDVGDDADNGEVVVPEGIQDQRLSDGLLGCIAQAAGRGGIDQDIGRLDIPALHLVGGKPISDALIREQPARQQLYPIEMHEIRAGGDQGELLAGCRARGMGGGVVVIVAEGHRVRDGGIGDAWTDPQCARHAVGGAGRNISDIHIHNRILVEAEIDIPGEGYLGKNHGRGDAQPDGDGELQHHQCGARQAWTLGAAIAGAHHRSRAEGG